MKQLLKLLLTLCLKVKQMKIKKDKRQLLLKRVRNLNLYSRLNPQFRTMTSRNCEGCNLGNGLSSVPGKLVFHAVCKVANLSRLYKV